MPLLKNNVFPRFPAAYWFRIGAQCLRLSEPTLRHCAGSKRVELEADARGKLFRASAARTQGSRRWSSSQASIHTGPSDTKARPRREGRPAGKLTSVCTGQTVAEPLPLTRAP